MKSRDANEDADNATSLRAARLRQLVHHLLEQEERAKCALANELHDELGSHLTAINLDLTSVAMRLKDDQPVLAERLERCMRLLRESVEITRRMMHALRPTMLDSLGLCAALRMLCEEFTERTSVPCLAECNDALPELEPAVALALCRVAEEALNNIERHADARGVQLVLRHDADRLTLEIRDDGVGIAPQALASSRAHGLSVMHERLASSGGHTTIRAGDAGIGTTVEAVVPLRNGAVTA